MSTSPITRCLAAMLAATYLLALATTGEARRCRRDADCDGISNQEERALGTRRRDADTDGDGLTDGFEALRLGSDPTLPDSDGDGMEDGDEMDDGTDPGNPEDGEEHGTYGHVRVWAPVDAVDAEAGTMTLLGSLVVDVAEAAARQHLDLATVEPGAFVKVKLVPDALPALVAQHVVVVGDEDHEGEDDDQSGTEDDGESDAPEAD